jgi:hypothetical protein
VSSKASPLTNHTRERNSRLRRVFIRIKKIVRILSVLVFGLLIIELIFGNWLNSDRLNQLNIIKDTELTYDIGDLYEANYQRVVYRRDHYGFRGQYGGDPNKIDVLTMGGSTTDQRYMPEGYTWQDILEQKFIAHQQHISIANAGVDGQSSFGHIRDFDWWFPSIPRLHAKYYLFYIGINDFLSEDHNDDLNDGTLINQLKQKSALYYLYRTMKGIYRVKRAGLSHRAINFRSLEWVDIPKIHNHAQLAQIAIQEYNKRLRLLADRVHKLNGTPIFVTQSFRKYKREDGKVLGVAETISYGNAEINGVDCYLIMQLFNDTTMNVCRETGSICIDLATELNFDDGDFYDFYHNTPKGTEKIGSYLYKKLSTSVAPPLSNSALHNPRESIQKD